MSKIELKFKENRRSIVVEKDGESVNPVYLEDNFENVKNRFPDDYEEIWKQFIELKKKELRVFTVYSDECVVCLEDEILETLEQFADENEVVKIKKHKMTIAEIINIPDL